MKPPSVHAPLPDGRIAANRAGFIGGGSRRDVVRATGGRRQQALAIGLSLALSGCGAVGSVKRAVLGGGDTGPHVLSGFIGGVAADEPRAALVGREVLATGGNAADAAVAMGFMLAVTLPSRASLGAGGACIAYAPDTGSPNRGVPEAILFPPIAPRTLAGDRPAAVPMLARGLYLLLARYGSEQIGRLMAPAEEAAQFGFGISRALALDIAEVAGPLAGDPAAGALFVPGGRPLADGARLVQPELAATFSQLRTVGVGDMYQGLLAHKLAEVTAEAGGPVGVEDLRLARPALAPALEVPAGDDQVALLPAPIDGGRAAAAAFAALRANPRDLEAANRAALAAAAAARGGSLPALPASTSFVALDRKGDAVACALTLDNLFGTGRIAPGTGIVLGASPAAKPMPLLEAGIGWNDNLHAFRAAVGASGQEAAAVAEAAGLQRALAGESPGEVPPPGRTNAALCPRYLPGDAGLCRFATDPRGAGFATGG